jgi:hypothetical protein
VEPNRPFRWDIAGGARVGTLIDDVAVGRLWYLDELVACAAKVLARSADGDLWFVGRSVDSLYDLLSGALSGTSWAARVHPLPLSYSDGSDALRPRQVAQLRANLAAEGLAPHDLARRRGPAVLVDLVWRARTFTNLYRFVRTWVDDDRAQWDVVRRKLRFVGIVQREKTSPKTWRWQQHVDWTRELPASAVANVSISPAMWNWFGNEQPKTAESFRPEDWLDPDVGRAVPTGAPGARRRRRAVPSGRRRARAPGRPPRTRAAVRRAVAARARAGAP